MNDISPAQESGARLDFLYDAFQSAQKTADESPTAEHQQTLNDSKDALFFDIENYAERVISKLYAKNAWKINQLSVQNNMDVVQSVCLQAWAHLSAGRFKRESQFSTWLFTVVKNALTDSIRQRSKLAEEALTIRPRDRFESEYDTRRERDERVYTDAGWLIGCGKSNTMSAELRFILLSFLSPEDHEFVKMKLEGRSAKEIAPRFGGSTRRVENEYARITRLLRGKLSASKHETN